MYYRRSFEYFRPGEIEEIQSRGSAALRGEISELRRRLAAREEGDLRTLQRELVAKEALRKELEGWDDRREPYQIRERSRLREHVKRVGALAMKGGAVKTKEKDGKSWGDVNGMCPGVAFHEQPYMDKSIGTFFFWSTDIAITAWHCVDDRPWQDLRLMHGFMMQPKGKVQKPIPRRLASAPERVGNTDWAILRVKPRKKAPQFDPIEVAADSSVSDTTYMIGHPMGLPLKVARNGEVKVVNPQENPDNLLFAELDAYELNSGSPVFCEVTHQLLGIMIYTPSGIISEDQPFSERKGIRVASHSGEGCNIFMPRVPYGSSLPCAILRIETLQFP